MARKPSKPLLFACWTAAVAILGTTGWVQGKLTGRWATSPDLEMAAARLGQLPATIGTWKGVDMEIDQRMMQRAGITASVQRRYHDSVTDANVTVLLVCGRPGPISVHTPDVCYAGAGYEAAAPPSRPIPGFFAARMIRANAAISESLQVYWSWNGSGQWEAPDNPRLRFAARPHLYKLYVIRSTAVSDANLEASPAAEFARLLTANLSLAPAAATAGGPKR